MPGGWRRSLWRGSAAWVLGAMAVVPLLAAEMDDDAYREAVAQLDARAEKALAHCKRLAAGSAAQRRCTVEADSQHAVDAAQLQAQRHPSGNNRFKALAAQVDRRHALAVEDCKTRYAGNDKDSKSAQQDCLREAKQKRAAGIQDAHQQAASEVSIFTPPKSEAERQREADLDTAIRKCDSLLGDANVQCVRGLSPEARLRAISRGSGASPAK
ncbi:hypothetical protein [Comamonas sp. MYb396]|uniref:hypothetical protein n=1 Tax=Comamonas sp. MYb396 TaxID=2745302 RepID=UPI0030A2A0A2